MGIMNSLRRSTIRGPINPLDRSTIVSIYPKHIRETKHTLQPSTFDIEPGTYEKPSLLVIGPSSWWREIDEEQPLLEISVSSIQIADSVVKDYCSGLIACDMVDRMPGLFFLPGDFSVKKLQDEFQPIIDRAREKQRNWYQALTKLADVMWSKTNGNPATISDDMRLAAHELGMESKDWLKNFQAMELIRCVACGQMRNSAYPICPNCKAVIDVAAATKMNLKFAQ